MELKGSLPCSQESCHWTLSWPSSVESRPSHISVIAKLCCRIPGDVSIRHRSLFGWSIRRSVCFASSTSRQCSPGKEMRYSLTPCLWDPLRTLASLPPFFHCHSHKSFSTSYGHFLAPYSLLSRIFHSDKFHSLLNKYWKYYNVYIINIRVWCHMSCYL
jgi:hypothetical protein